jgi:hypothetical protein
MDTELSALVAEPMPTFLWESAYVSAADRAAGCCWVGYHGLAPCNQEGYGYDDEQNHEDKQDIAQEVCPVCRNYGLHVLLRSGVIVVVCR